MADTSSSTLGYVFYPSQHPDDPAHPRMDVFLSEEPRGLHFDPVQVQYSAVTGRDEIQPLTVEHPWSLLKNYRVTAGRVILRNRLGKIQSGFSYGGELKIDTGERQTTCILTSPAPILNMTVERSVANLLAVETEVLLAERRAAWAQSQDSYEKRLAELDPSRLFLACVEALSARFHRRPGSDNDLDRKFLHYLDTIQRESRWHEAGGGAAPLEEIL